MPQENKVGVLQRFLLGSIIALITVSLAACGYLPPLPSSTTTTTPPTSTEAEPMEAPAAVDSAALVILEPVATETMIGAADSPAIGASSSASHSMSAFCKGDPTAFVLAPAERRKLYTICTAWYPGSEVPELPATDAWGNACATALKAPYDEIDFLQSAFDIRADGSSETSADVSALCFMAVLDRDQDGVRDYQVTVNGRFVENDIDVDQDGVPNVRDTNPVDSDEGEPLACGSAPLPRHLSFACEWGTDKACQLQKQLFEEFDIVVVNRDLVLDQQGVEKNLQTVYDAANLVFRKGFSTHPGRRTDNCAGLWTMQTVALEQCVEGRTAPWNPADLSCQNEDDQSTEASAMAHNGLFTIYPAGAELPRIIQLGTYVHELGHLWQFAYDIHNEEDTAELISDNLWIVPEFEKELAKLGWQFTRFEEPEIQALRDLYATVLPREYELVVYPDDSYIFGDYSVVAHRQAVDLEGLVTSRENQKLGNFGSYSLKDPWEWQADLFIAYLFRSLEDRIMKRSSIEVAGEFITWFRAHVLDTYRNNFYHPNLKSKLFEHMRKKVLPIPVKALDELVCRYLVNDEYVFTPLEFGSTLPFALDEPPKKIPPDHVSEEIKSEWGGICARFNEVSS